MRRMNKIGERIKEARLLRGWTQAQLGKKCGVTRSAVSQWEKGDTVPDFTNLQSIAKILDINFLWLSQGQAETSISNAKTEVGGPTNDVRVVGIVQAGVWREAIETEEPVQEAISVPINSRYAGLPRYALKVSGDSVNELIRDGGFAICVRLDDLGRDPLPGELVHVERIRQQGGLYESTIKEFRMNGKGPELWPRSTNPLYQNPISLTDERDSEVEVVIKGIVIGRYDDF